jgi:hypothetical protein
LSEDEGQGEALKLSPEISDASQRRFFIEGLGTRLGVRDWSGRARLGRGLSRAHHLTQNRVDQGAALEQPSSLRHWDTSLSFNCESLDSVSSNAHSYAYASPNRAELMPKASKAKANQLPWSLQTRSAHKSALTPREGTSILCRHVLIPRLDRARRIKNNTPPLAYLFFVFFGVEPTDDTSELFAVEPPVPSNANGNFDVVATRNAAVDSPRPSSEVVLPTNRIPKVAQTAG